MDDDFKKKQNLQLAADAARESVNRSARESVRLIQERNRRENMERYGCNCPAAKCYATCPKVLARAGGDERQKHIFEKYYGG